jgi:hypothetical protein
MTRKLPTAELVLAHPSGNKLWLVKWPSTPQKSGKSYYVTTYANSERIFLETAAKRRPVSETVGRRIHPQVRDAIARASNAL